MCADSLHMLYYCLALAGTHQASHPFRCNPPSFSHPSICLSPPQTSSHPSPLRLAHICGFRTVQALTPPVFERASGQLPAALAPFLRGPPIDVSGAHLVQERHQHPILASLGPGGILFGA